MADLDAQSLPEIPGHTLLRVIGRGAYGEVWLAQTAGGDWRAVKVVRREAFDSDRPFERECRGLAAAAPVTREHEGLVTVHEVARVDAEPPRLIAVMDLADDVSGGERIPADYEPRTLARELSRRDRLPPAQAMAMARQLAEALAHLHACGLVHRDVKPSNIIFIDGQPCLADVGMAADPEGASTVAGTPGYVPPEGAGRTGGDVFALGLVLYEMATGRDRLEFPDFPSGQFNEEETAQLAAINEVVMRACAPNPKHRYPTATAMAADLRRLEAGEALAEAPGTATRWPLVVAAGMALAVWLAWPEKASDPAPPAWQAGQVAHYSFSGDGADAAAGQTHAGTSAVLLGADRHGQEQSALRFINGRSEAYFTGGPVKVTGPDLTVGLWFKPNITNYERTLLEQDWAGGGSFQVSIREGRLSGRFRGVDGVLLMPGPPVLRHTWQHAAWTYEAASGKVTIFLNGQPAAEANATSPLAPADGRLMAGQAAIAPFTGWMDEFRVFNRALSAAEVAQWFAHEQPAAERLAAEPWDFDYAYSDVFEPEADRYLHATNHVRKYREPGEADVTYWGPVREGSIVGGDIIYRFPFERPSREIFLYTTLHTWDLAQLGLGRGQGTGKLEASRDGTNWFTLHDLTQPRERFGGTIEHADLLPAKLTGTQEIFVKMTMRVHGAKPGLSYSTAHHSNNEAHRRAEKHNVFELKARLQ